MPPEPSRDSALRVVSIYPQLLGTYGDTGNTTAVLRRSQARGIPTELIVAEPGRPLPRQGDLYLLGGAEDANQAVAAGLLGDDGGLTDAAGRGATVFAVCAGFQILGQHFPGPVGRCPGLGLLDTCTGRLPGRAVGDLFVDATTLGLPTLVGFENHAGATTLGADALPLGVVLHGVGNAGGTSGAARRPVDGAVQGSLIGTYLHGPVLALNPALTDLLIARVAGPLPALDTAWVQDVRQQRLAQPWHTGMSGRPAGGPQRLRRSRWPRRRRPSQANGRGSDGGRCS